MGATGTVSIDSSQADELKLPVFKLELHAVADSIAVVRQALGGLSDALALRTPVLADMNVAVTEACTNAVLHAYSGSDGTLEVEAHAAPEVVNVVVRDCGSGVAARPVRPPGETLGLGMPLMEAVADGFEVVSPPEGGTEVHLRFERNAPRDRAGAALAGRS